MMQRMARIVLINPAFKPSYWNFHHSLPIFDRRAVTPTSALTLLAALTPEEHDVVLMDEAVEPLDFSVIDQADIVGMTGMIVQRERMAELARTLKARGAFLVVGGPWITVREDALQGLADVIFVGEADQTWPEFLGDYARGSYRIRYEQTERTDLTTLPPQRIDLLKTRLYLQGSLQLSRGCPFLCEFCDIIVTFGRQPRVKRPEQVIEELEAWSRAGMMALFLVDDNIIGNRKALIPILKAIADWQRRKAYLVSLHTEASINLADDEELLDLFVEANIRTVFIGIESPSPEALLEARKFQNVDRKSVDQTASAAEDFLLEKIHRIQMKGIKVTSGHIVGFDSDTPSIFATQSRFIGRSGITQAMVGLLSAIPKTPLYARLQGEGRLDHEDPPRYGTNVIPKHFTPAELARGYLELLVETYAPEAYLSRLDDLYIRRRFYDYAESVRVPNISRPRQWVYLVMSLGFTAGVLFRLMKHAGRDGLRWTYLRAFIHYARSKPYPMRYFDYVVELACHYHFYCYTEDMRQGRGPVISTF